MGESGTWGLLGDFQESGPLRGESWNLGGLLGDSKVSGDLGDSQPFTNVHTVTAQESPDQAT